MDIRKFCTSVPRPAQLPAHGSPVCPQDMSPLLPESIVTALRGWLNKADKKNTLIVQGPTGSGKTTLVHICLESAGLDLMPVDMLGDMNLARARAAHSAVVVDGVEQMEAGTLKGIKRVSRLLPSMPFLLLCLTHGKMSEFVKSAETICIPPPQPDVLLHWVQKKTGDVRSARAIVSSLPAPVTDIRRVLHAVDTYKVVGTVSQASVQDAQFDAMTTVKRCFAPTSSLQQAWAELTCEPRLYQMIIAESYPDAAKNIGSCADAADVISHADVMESHLYGSATWGIAEPWSVLATVHPCRVLAAAGAKTFVPRFSRHSSHCSCLAQSTTQFSGMRHATSHFCHVSIELWASERAACMGLVVWGLLSQGMTQEVKDLARSYGLTAAHLHELLKRTVPHATPKYKATHRAKLKVLLG